MPGPVSVTESRTLVPTFSHEMVTVPLGWLYLIAFDQQVEEDLLQTLLVAEHVEVAARARGEM